MKLFKNFLFALIAMFVVIFSITQCSNPEASALRYGKNLISIDSTLLGDGTLLNPFSVNLDSIIAIVNDSIAADNGTEDAIYSAVLLGADGSFTSATEARNDLSATVVWARSAEGVYTGTLTGAFTANKTIGLVTLGSATGGVITKLVRTSDNVVTLSTFLVTDGTTADDFVGTLNVVVRVSP